MYQVLIVDDEIMIRRGLCKIIAWEALGFEVAAAVGDAGKALQVLTEQPIDVILTDINMPKISGLDLIRMAKERRPGIKTVVISGYSEFDYAIEAIKLKVENYILKPLDPEKITDIFKALKDTMDKERQTEQKEQYLQSEYQLLRGIDSRNKGFGGEDYGRLIKMLEEGNHKGLEGFVEELFQQLEGAGEGYIRDYCLKALRNGALYFHLEDLPLFQIYRLNQKEHVDTNLIKASFLADLELLMGRLRERGESNAAIVSSQARQYIESHYRDKALSLKTVAQTLGVSYGYLSTAFARTYGENFKTYLVTVRIEKARELLLERKYKIFEIADMVGYGSSRYFTDAFKQRYGVSPIEYLNRLNSQGGE